MGPHFLLSFGTVLGKTRTLRINNASDTVTDTLVRGAMNAVITSQTVSGTSGRVSTRRRATLVETQVTSITID